MKYVNKIKKIGIYICIISIILSFTACGGESKETYKTNLEVSYEAEDVLEIDDMKEDLDFIKNTIKEVHPDPYNNFSENEFDEKWDMLKEKIKDPIKYKEFNLAALEAISISGDPHTTADFDNEYDELDLQFTWTKEGAWVNEDNGYLKAGDSILKIGDKSLDEILLNLKKIIPSNNEYLIMSLGKEMIKNRYALESLDLLDKKQRVKIEVMSSDNDNKIAYLKFKEKLVQDNNPFSYKVMPMAGLGTLKMDMCLNSEEYKTYIRDFFNEVIERNVTSIAIDLRNNTGGEISVLDELLKYIDVEEYNNYNIELKKSKQAAERGLKRTSIISNLFSGNTIEIEHETNNLFDGNIFVLTSTKTSNEANEMAVIIKDNNIGKIIGEYTGNAPNGYGRVLKFTAPNTGLNFYVSTSTYKRPNEKAAYENTLKPDTYVTYTQDDIINGNDPVLDAVKEIIKENEIQ